MTSTEKRLIELWEEIPEENQGEMIARLLDQTQAWHSYAISEPFAMSWLRANFNSAGVELPERLQPGRNGAD